MKLSIIIPVFNEYANVSVVLKFLQPQRDRGVEIIVVDGGSSDDTLALASALGVRTITAARGRATQQNAGAQIATGDTLLFLHSDTRLPDDVDALIAAVWTERDTVWGRFDVKLDAGELRSHFMLNVIATMMNFRSRTTGIATGDQCIFVRKSAFQQISGFPNIRLMEDIALSKALKKISAPACLREQVTTSARRWQQQGVWRTMVLMWWLRFAYWAGVSPTKLAAWYR